MLQDYQSLELLVCLCNQISCPQVWQQMGEGSVFDNTALKKMRR